MTAVAEVFVTGMTAGAWVAVAAVLVASAIGLLRAAVDGRFRGSRRVPSALAEETPGTRAARSRTPAAWAPVSEALPGAQLGARATLLQFSSAFCAPCRATRRVLADVAGGLPGVEHLEVDAEQHLELVRALGVVRTPTTIVLDAAGAEVARAAGAPRKEQVLAAVARVV